MMLHDKNAVIYGGGGAIGGAVARAFAREGARLFLAGRTLAKLEKVAHDISDAGGQVEIAAVDALDEKSVHTHADSVAATAGSIDIALNAVGIMHVMGPTINDLSVADYMQPIMDYTRTNFITVKAVARHMMQQGRGVVLTISTPGGRRAGAGYLGNGVSFGAIETFSRLLAGELGSSGIRVICLRPDAIPEAAHISYTRELFGGANSDGTAVEAALTERARSVALLERGPTLAEVANMAAFVASDSAGAMTGAIVNLTCGTLVD